MRPATREIFSHRCFQVQPDSHACDLLELIFPQPKANALDLARHPSQDND